MPGPSTALRPLLCSTERTKCVRRVASGELAPLQDGPHVQVVILRVRQVERRRVARHGRVHVHVQLRDAARLLQIAQVIQNLLRPADGERRDEHHPALAVGGVHRVGERVHGRHVAVGAVPVGALHHQRGGAGHALGVPEDGGVVAAQVAGEDDALAGARQIEHAHRRAEDVARAHEGERDAGEDFLGPVIAEGLEQGEGAPGVGHGVERLGGAVAGEALLVGVAGLLLLQVRRVRQQQRGEVPRAGGGEDGPVVAGAHQARQPAGVIDVGVRQHHHVDRLRLHRQRRPVALAQLLGALEQAAVHQHAHPVVLEEESGAGDRARRAEEVDGAHRGADCRRSGRGAAPR